MTFSLLPDFLSARLPDSLAAIEQVIGVAASARSIEQAADAVRGPDICLPGAVRWLRRRIVAVRKSVAAVGVMAPGLSHLVTNEMLALTDLRRALAPQLLLDIPVPLGFRRGPRTNDCGALGYLAPAVVGQGASAMPPTIITNTRRDLISLSRPAKRSPVEGMQCPYITIEAMQPSLPRPPPMRFAASGVGSGGLVQERRTNI
ncbi:hypothetical protein REMIM1_PE00104 (plasmid) [Rhizobium etli bv. mimosae str. Mim1]|nr:hypothetical protein REMIM1_PE00054 [Rhizobium etli bv. mimosae str. Mim1]AGS25195.1 hypothetical protein REMIM1_PE00104 [Rhizobium etli bv. mimosae str. Mim1]